MSRDWLNQSGNPAMRGWELEADDLYAGVIVVDMTTPAWPVALSADFETYVQVVELAQVGSLQTFNGEATKIGDAVAGSPTQAGTVAGTPRLMLIRPGVNNA